MVKTHRVGTFTLGGLLIVFGILFLLRIFYIGITYDLIFKLWPTIFIFLGGEILIANFKEQGEKLLYDKTAFVLIFVLSFFAMGMAVVDYCLNFAYNYITVY
jgi:UDP-N-acetylmuramyl pentapeptide phosphotransferase/UDP-N-acetylglucosamine-1-phosphate transferase